MYVTLFNIAGWAMLGWLLIIFLPTWRVTRWIAETALFPVLLSILYLVGIGAVLLETGPGLMSDFGSAEGVVGLLRNPDIALVAWLHILAFDQAVALMMYRDNMRRRFMPLPVQSIILFLTLMFGPVGYLLYRVAGAVSRRKAEEMDARPASVGKRGPEGHVATQLRAAAGQAAFVFRRERVLTAAGLMGIVVGIGCGVAILARGSALVGAEGHLDKAMTFNIALGMYVLSLVLLLPLARFSRVGLAIWRTMLAGLTVFSVALETGQIARGLDPRFTRVGAVSDQVLGGVFFLTALVIVALFVVLAFKLVRVRVDAEHAPMQLAVRYACAATFGGFAAGIWMSALNGSRAGEASVLPLHALGFHGLQALPLVALLLAWAGVPAHRARGPVHAAGIAWLAACAAVAWQTVDGVAILSPTPAMGLALAALLAWAAVAALAARAWLAGDGAPSIRPATA